LLALIALLIARYGASLKRERNKSQTTLPSTPLATFVGAKKCGLCHESEFKRWMGSHHQLAMLPANRKEVKLHLFDQLHCSTDSYEL
jgi:hypothetical protein